MRRLSSAFAAVGTAAMVATGSIVPAQAAPIGEAAGLLRILNDNVATANCDVLRVSLRGAGLVGPETTRGQLVANVNTLVGKDAALRLVSAPTVGALGDRALECGIVKPDPVTPLDQAIAMSSQLSSRAGLPELRNVSPALR